jgi:hypothetical protein
MKMSDDVSDDDSIDDETNWAMEIVWNLEKVARTMEKTLRGMIIDAMEQTLLSIVFIGKDKTKWGNVKSKQMAKYFDKIAWCFSPSQESHYTLRNVQLSITYEILDNISQHRNQYILIIQPNFSHESDAILTEKIEVKTFIGFLCLAGALRSNNQSLEELWGTDGDDIDNFLLVMSQRLFKSQIKYILEQTRVESIKFFTFH